MRSKPAICVLQCAILLGGCGQNQAAGVSAGATRVDRRTLRQVSVPDLSKITSTSVQHQLRDGESALRASMSNPAATDADLGAAYGAMGKLLMAAEYRDAAEPSLLNAEALAPQEMRWPYYLAHLYKLKGDAARSTAAFERALKIKPDDVPTLVWLGNAYLDEGRTAEAESILSRAQTIDPRSVVVLFGLGKAALARKDYTRAVDYLEQALTLDPKGAVIHYPLAMAYRALGNTASAEAHLARRGPGDLRPKDPLMFELDSMLESAVAYEVRGAQALDDSDWPTAVEYFRKAIALAPDEPSLRHKLGTALAMTGDPRAVEQFEEVTRRWPKFAKAHYSLGVILAANGLKKEAIEQFVAAVTNEPAYSEARLQLAETLRASGRYQEALKQYEETITMNPQLAGARLGYGMALAGLGRFDAARAQFAEGAAAFPDRPEFTDALSRLPPAGANR